MCLERKRFGIFICKDFMIIIVFSFIELLGFCGNYVVKMIVIIVVFMIFWVILEWFSE